jgi:general secretion pathway protein K
MLTVTLVATLAAAALWQQWRSVEVEAAERTRMQAAWMLTGAQDWARLILREDAAPAAPTTWASPGRCRCRKRACHLPGRRPRRSADAASDTDNVFLSGQITDQQGC